MKNIGNRTNLSEYIVQDLENRIIKGELKPGERIIEKELCETYGISITPVREALRVLESQGFISHEPRKGVSVAKITVEEAEDIYRINAYLESLATYLAVKNQDPKVLEELKKIHAKMVKLAESKKITVPYKNLHIKFHEIIVCASKNKKLIQMIQTFTKQTKHYRFTALIMPERIKSSLEIHEKLIRFFEEGNAKKAESLRKKSILRNIRIFSQKIAEENIGENP